MKRRITMFFEDKLIFPTGGRSNYRIPSLVVTNSGKLLAFCNDRKDTVSDGAEVVALVMCKKEADGKWSEVIPMSDYEGWDSGIGSAVYDPSVDKVMVFGGRSASKKHEFVEYTEEQILEMKKKTEEEARKMGFLCGQIIFSSFDEGESWSEAPLVVAPADQLHWDGKVYSVVGNTHGAAHGIQLRHGKCAGRLLCPARTNIGKYKNVAELARCTYNNAIYSDDHGETWSSTSCVQVGTGEGTLIENADGSITYNSRAYFKDGKRYLATSYDGGLTYCDFRDDYYLLEEKNIGCNASFIRVELDEIDDKSMLPEYAEGVTVFCNPKAETRDNMTACVSFDAGKTWSIEKQIYPHHASYSSLVWNKVTQKFCLIHERGTRNAVSDGIAAVEFDLEWLLSK